MSKEIKGFCIESSEGIIQHGTFSDEEERAIELFLDTISFCEETSWEELQKMGFKVCEVVMYKIEPEKE